MSSLTLFELTDEILATIDEIVDAEIERDPELLDTLYAELDGLYGARTEKHEGYVHVIKNAEAAVDACKAEAARFTARAQALHALSHRLKETLRMDLAEHGEKTAEAGKFKITRQNGTQRVVVSVDPAELPEGYQRVSIEADKTELKKALKHGEEISGVELESTEHVRIRVK